MVHLCCSFYICLQDKLNVVSTIHLNQLWGEVQNIKDNYGTTPTKYLEQNNFIFSGSVYDNLTLGKEVDRNWLEQKLVGVGLEKRVTIDSQLQGNGENLSGGEKLVNNLYIHIYINL